VEIDGRLVRRPNPGQEETEIELGIDEEDDNGRPNSNLEYDPWMEDMLDYVHDRQCGHSPETARRVYSDTDHILQGMDGMSLKFRRCSKSLWRFYADATGQRRDGAISAKTFSTVRCTRSTVSFSLLGMLLSPRNSGTDPLYVIVDGFLSWKGSSKAVKQCDSETDTPNAHVGLLLSI
jgi:hypothetical protein